MMGLLTFSILALAIALAVKGDINMHNPRGSNNRQDETTRDRKSGNRLFDSQNNARGGHNVGPFPGAMHFYAGSQLRIQWAHQHTCGDQNNFCNIVIQYMCDDNLRDGTTTKRPPLTCTDDCDTNIKYGHHESLTYYEQCASRERNKGLFTANRGAQMGDSAQHTRQNNGGGRNGYECPEERDYYPYFGPSPWRDIAVFTNNKTRCEIYTSESQNDKSKWACTLPDDYWNAVRGKLLNGTDKVADVYLFNEKDLCEEVSIVYDGVTYNGIWKEYPAHGIDPPECLDEPWSRDNHQGNTIGGEFIEYNWTIPDIDESSCALRIRYNISTNDFEPWNTDHTQSYDKKTAETGPEKIQTDFDFLEGADPIRRHYYLRDNPNLDVFNLRVRKQRFTLRVALNTAQYGRTFQDRSHSFAIVRRPADLEGVNIYNLNVRGKRGNLQQVFPSTEYDFVPNKLIVQKDDYVHIQWTGSDTNNAANNGQGKAGTDRHNMLPLARRPYAEGTYSSNLTLGTNYPIRDMCEQQLLGQTREGLTILALGGYYEIGETPGETLDDGDAYFDYGPKRMTGRGMFHYFSTRNNAFTNRNQKATIIVE